MHHKNKKYIVRLEVDERQQLERLVSVGKGAARKLTRARVLLQADEGEGGPAWPDVRIVEALGVSVGTVENLRKRLVEEGLSVALEGKRPVPRPRMRKLDGEKEAKLIAVACSAPPEGRAHWTLRLLADRLVELEVVDTISYETVRQTLKKKCVETVAETDVVHSTAAERRVRLCDGRGAGRIPAALRSEVSEGVYG